MPTIIFVRVQWLMQTRAFILENNELIFTIKQKICLILGLDPDLYCAIIRINYQGMRLDDEHSLKYYNIGNNARVICSMPRARIFNLRKRRNFRQSASYFSAAMEAAVEEDISLSSPETLATQAITEISPLLSFVSESKAVDGEPTVAVEKDGVTLQEMVEEKKVDDEMESDDCTPLLKVPPSLMDRQSTTIGHIRKKKCNCCACQLREKAFGRKSFLMMNEFTDRNSLGFQMFPMMGSTFVNTEMFEMDEDELLKQAIEASLADQKVLENLKERQTSEVEE